MISRSRACYGSKNYWNPTRKFRYCYPVSIDFNHIIGCSRRKKILVIPTRSCCCVPTPTRRRPFSYLRVLVVHPSGVTRNIGCVFNSSTNNKSPCFSNCAVNHNLSATVESRIGISRPTITRMSINKLPLIHSHIGS